MKNNIKREDNSFGITVTLLIWLNYVYTINTSLSSFFIVEVQQKFLSRC